MRIGIDCDGVLRDFITDLIENKVLVAAIINSVIWKFLSRQDHSVVFE